MLSLTTWFSATAIMPELIVALGLTPAEASWLTNAVQAGFVVGALTSSVLALADIWRLTALMTVACLAAAVLNALLLVAPSAWIAIALRFATGASLALIYPPAMKFIATWFRTGRGLAMGVMVGALTLGSAMPHLVRGLGQGLDWRIVIMTSSVGALIAAGIFTFAVREGPFAFARATVDLGQIGAVLRDRPVMLANFGYFGHMWELYAMWGWFLVYCTAAQTEGLEFANASLLSFAVIAMGMPGCIFCGWLADRIGRCLATSLMMLLSASAALAIGFAFDGPFWLFAMIALVWGFTIVADSAQFSAAVSELADQRLVGSSLALQMGIGFALTIFVIWLTPIVADILGGWRWTFLLLVPGPIVGIAAMLALRRDPRSVKLADGRR
ncbi:MAG: nitrate/nitrite transporter [Hyphomicrobiaceae bacterium]